jgi:hypothetical protein
MSRFWIPLLEGKTGTLPFALNAPYTDVQVSAIASVPLSYLYTDSSNLRYGVGISLGATVTGIMKQNVANAILPADASGSVVGYSYIPTGYYDGRIMNQLRINTVNLYKAKGVKYCVTDLRGNFGGSYSNAWAPFGYTTRNYGIINAIIPVNPTGVGGESTNHVNMSTMVADILNNPTNYPPTWRYPVDSSGITITTNGGVDNTAYKQTGNIYSLVTKGGLSSIPQTDLSVDGSNNGQGILSNTFLNSTETLSASKLFQRSLKGHSDDNDYNNSAGPNLVTNTHFTYYGVNTHLLYITSVQSDNDWNTSINVNPGSGGSLTNNVFIDGVGQLQCNQYTYDKVGNQYMNSFRAPANKMDAVPNYSPMTLMTEIGVYYDASGIQQGHNGTNHNAYHVSNDNTASYRDFRLERSVQMAYAQRSACRAQPKFGYMPIDTSITFEIVDLSGSHIVTDPYNWNITDTSGAFVIPANPFDL